MNPQKLKTELKKGEGLHLTVEVVVVIIIEVPLALSTSLSSSSLAVREPEVVPEAPGLLESLTEHLVLLDVVVGDGPSGELHGLFEVFLGDLRDWVLVIVHVHGGSRAQLRKSRLGVSGLKL